jgi:hypothetical protein
MKTGTLIPTIMALAVLVCSPFNGAPAQSSGLQEGLVCYCCLSKGITCTCSLLSCPKCDTGAEKQDSDRAPDLVNHSFLWAIHLQPVLSQSESQYSPGTWYGKVPVKPPNTF